VHESVHCVCVPILALLLSVLREHIDIQVLDGHAAAVPVVGGRCVCLHRRGGGGR
jgi:hypothetical protein